MNSERIRQLAVRGAFGLSLTATAWSGLVAPLFAQTASVCTVVKLELAQKAALEREAFNAHLVLTNNQADLPLSSLRITVSIKDSLGNPADALFFNKVTDMAGISAVDGTGTMQPAALADIKWLIIPAPGAGGSLKEGTPYSVTAQISYVSGETPNVNVTQPAYITVYPQPLLTLEYMLPFEVFGVDPFTLTGTTEPFPLGLRVSNVGAGTAVNFKIASSQPEISDNKQGLPISFQIVETFLNSNPLPDNTLTIPFGNILPGGSALASWQMTSSFSGRFTDFTVTATHDASLGGALTSLIQGVTTYTVMKDVLNDRPGHDAQYDLLVNLATPRSQMESDYQSGLEPKPDALIDSDRPGFTPVQNLPAHLGGALSGSNGVLNIVFDQAVPTGTWVHASIPFPQGDAVPLKSVIRSDGKAINPRNAWIAKHIDKLTNTRTYFLHVLDYSSSEPTDYAMTFDAAALVTPPDAISNLSAQPSGNGVLALTWNATGAAGSSGAIVGGRYAIFASTDPDAVPSVAGAAVSFSTATEALARQDYPLTGLLGNATYQIGVFLANAAGQFSAVSNIVAVQTLANPPTAVQVVSITTSGFSLSWTNSTNAAGAEYQVSLAGAEQTAFIADQTSAAFVDLNPNQTYSVISAQRNSAQALTPTAAIADVTTLALPPATTSPAFVSITTGSAEARWLLGGNPSDTEFFAELSTSASRAPIFAASGWVRAESFSFAGLTQGTTFYGQVKARNRLSVETSYADLGAIRTTAVDFLPPQTSLVVGSPTLGASPVYIATGTPLSLIAVDDETAEGDGIGLGVAQTFFAIDSSTFAAYAGTFTIAAFGSHTIAFYSVDVLGNAEVSRSTQVVVAEPPAAVVDLLLAAVNPASITLRWTEPTSIVPLVIYDLRRATFPITTGNFDAAIPIAAPAPTSSGTILTIEVSSVTEPGFYAALVSRDALGGVSPLSNVTGLTRSTVIVNGLPELAFSANQPVTATLLSSAEGQGAVAFMSATASGLILVSSIYDLGPEGAVFDPYAALTLRYSTASVAALGLAPSDLAIYHYVANTGWVAVSTQTLSSNDQSVTAAVPSLASIFALLGRSHVPPALALTPVHGSTATISTPRIAAVYSAIGPGIATATVRLTLDGADVTASAGVTASSAVFMPAADLSQGTHTVTAAVSDFAGNQATETATFLVDSIAPVTTLLINGRPVEAASLVIITTDSVGFAAIDSGTGILETLYELDGSTVSLVFSSTFTLSGGTHTLSYRSVDLAGNREELQNAALTVLAEDVAPPSLSLTPPDGSTATTASPPIVATYADSGRGIDSASVRLSVDGVDVTTLAFVTTSSAAFVPNYALAQGTHTFTASVSDLVGNSTAGSSVFIIDSLPPLTGLLVNGLAAGSTELVVISTDAIGFAATDSGTGVLETLYSVDGAAESVFASTFTLSPGSRSLAFHSRDGAGNLEAARILSITVASPIYDTTQPFVRLYFPGDAALGVEQAIGGVIDVRGAASDASAFNWTLEAAPGASEATGFATIASGVGNLSGLIAAWDTTALSGHQTLRLRATDAFGNTGQAVATVFVGSPVFTFAIGRKDSHVIFNRIKNPTGIAVRSDGAIWVANAESDKILLISPSGVLLGEAGHAPGQSGEEKEHGKKETDERDDKKKDKDDKGKNDDDDEDEKHEDAGGLGFKTPQGLALDAADNLYVADRDLNRVVKLSPNGQVLLLKLGKTDGGGRPKSGSGPGELRHPFDVAVDGNGDIYVADSGNSRIQVFNSSGVFLRQFGQSVLLQTSQVRGITLTAEGLWVSDKELERVFLFSRAGNSIKSIGDSDSVVGEISRTRGLASDRLGALYIVEPNRDRAQKFDPQGKGLLAFGSRAGLSQADKRAKRYLTMPIDAAVAPDGSIWITDTGRDRIVRYALPGSGGLGVAAYPSGGDAVSSSVEPARRVVDAKDGAKVERDDGAGVSVPEGALSADLEITVDKGDENQDKEQKTAKRLVLKVTAVSDEVQYGPEGTTFNTPVTLTLPYDANLLASLGMKEENLKVYYWNPTLQDWQAMPSIVDKENKTVNAETTHFSAYQVGALGGVGVAALDDFGIRDGYAFPNPSRNSSAVTFRMQPGSADSIEVRVYDVSGRRVHSSSDFRFRGAFDDGNGKGAQNTYDHVWDVSGVGSGVYTFVMTAKKAGQSDIRKTGKIGVVK